jgi:hypothetical protein
MNLFVLGRSEVENKMDGKGLRNVNGYSVCNIYVQFKA